MDRGDPLGRQDQHRDDEAGQGLRRAELFDADVHDDREFLRQQHDGKHGEDEQHGVEGHGSHAGRRVVFVDHIEIVARGLREEVAVPQCLDAEEHRIQGGTHRDQEDGDQRGWCGVGRRGCVPRQHQPEESQWQVVREICVGAAQIERRLAVLEPADDEGQPDQPVEYEHEHGEHGVAAERGVVVPSEHDGGDHGDFDADDRDRENDCAERLTEQDRQTVRVADDRKRGPENHAEEAGKEDGRSPWGLGRRLKPLRDDQPHEGGAGQTRDQSGF